MGAVKDFLEFAAGWIGVAFKGSRPKLEDIPKELAVERAQREAEERRRKRKQ